MHNFARGLALCLAVGGLAAADPYPRGIEHTRRSLADGTWALETRQSLSDLKTCDGCKVRWPLTRRRRHLLRAPRC